MRDAFDRFSQDFRYALRQLRKNAGFALFSVATLVIGLASALAAFSILDSWLIRPLDLKEADRLEHAWRTGANDHTQPQFFFMYGEYLKFARQTHSFSSLSATFYRDYTLTNQGSPEKVMGEITTPNLFATLGVRAALGRTFSAQDGAGEKTVVLSHAFWRQEFGASPSVIGKVVRLNDEPYRVIGVLPQHFSYRILDQPVDASLWTVIQRSDPNYGEDSDAAVGILGRLKPGVTRDQAQAEMNVIQRRIDAQRPQLPEEIKGSATLLSPLQEDNSRQIRFSVLVLAGASAFLLLIACANACALVLGRNAARQPEFAMRVALGSGAGRLFQQLLTESVVLYGIATIAGLLAAAAVVRGFALWNPMGVLPARGIGLNFRACVVAAGVALITSVLFGTLPAFFASRTVINDALGAMGRSLTAGKRGVQTLNWITGAQIALALVFVTGAGLLFSTLLHLQQQKFGFEAGRVEMLQLSLPYRHYSEISKAIAFENRLTQLLREQPGVTASAVGVEPTRGDEFPSRFVIFKGPPAKEADMPRAAESIIGPEFFQALKIPVIAGADFPLERGAHSEPEAIVNEQVTQRYFAGQNPIGQHIRFGAPEDKGTARAPWYRVIGVVGDTRSIAYNQTLWKMDPIVYLDYRQQRENAVGVANWGSRRCTFLIATARPKTLAAGKVRQLVLSLDSELPIDELSPLGNELEKHLAQPRMRAQVLTGFAGISLLLAAIGLYGILAQSVTRTKRSIAIRMALGARRKDVVRLVMARALSITAAGVLCGTAISVAAARAVHSVLYGISPLNPPLYAGAAGVLLAVSVAAALLPARRAANVDPMTTLRAE